MSYLPGTQNKFSDAVRHLLAVEYDAIESYQAARNRIQEKEYKETIEDHIKEHQEFVKKLEGFMQKHHFTFETGPSGKQMLSIGRIALAKLIDDKSVLRALISVEKASKKACEQMKTFEENDKSSHTLFKKGVAHFDAHEKWLSDHIQH
ncbi:MAG: hypothetical protein CMF48_00825 [Legionellales bacterium]|nr:hypothetical protein [Legionellales bacterium]|tara:strand:- start:505 stop:951 length:447 start_codon:yes stop_codon:yes gene_type:complete